MASLSNPAAMRQPPSRHRQAGAQSGFSLLELLIVLTIIAALAGLSVAWLDGDAGPTLDSARERLRIDLERAAIQAMEQQRVIGLLPGATGYTFVTRDAGSAEWQTLEAKALPARQWQLDIHLQRDPSAPEDSMVPWLVWWPDGEVLGGHLDLVSGDRRRRLVIDALGVRETMVQDATERDDA